MVGVQCVPLYTVVRALGRTHVDFLSLDVEHAEMGILDTIPWEALSFTVSLYIIVTYTLCYVLLPNGANLHRFPASY